MSGFEAAINEMMAEFEKQRQDMVHLQETVAALSGTATSPRRQLTVTVDARGELTSLKFHGQAFRTMAGEELATVIQDTIRAAVQNVRRQMWEQTGDVGPEGARLSDVANGTVDWSLAIGDALTIPQALIDMLQVSGTDLDSALGSGEERR